MTEKERLIRIVDYLRSQGHGSSQAEIGFCLGFSNRSSFNQVVTGKAKISNNFLERLKKLDPNINIDWLRSGNGEMLLSNNINNTPEFYVDFQPFNDCTAYLPIYGDSMYPHFSSGEIVAVKKVSNHDIILWGEAYLIITDTNANNMKTVKLLYPHEDEDKIILRASNPEYKGDTIIPKSSILNLYIVKGKITRKQL